MRHLISLLLFCFPVGNAFNPYFHTDFLSSTRSLQKLPEVTSRRKHSGTLKVSTSTDQSFELQTYHSNNYFWGQNRTKDEIARYCAGMIFPHEDISIAKEYIEVISEELPLVVIHNFLSEDMCECIIETAEESGAMKRSLVGES